MYFVFALSMHELCLKF